MNKKLKVGFFSFTGDEGCMTVFIELLNEHFFEWQKYWEVKASRLLLQDDEIKWLDVSFIEGAISTESELKKLKEIRKNSNKVVAIGSCAITGLPSAQRNFFSTELKAEIKEKIESLHQLPEIKPLKEFVKVDAEVPGCPMQEEKFIEVLEKYFKEFKVK